MNHLLSNYAKYPTGDKRILYMDDIINTASNAASRCQSQLNFDDKSWEKVYNKLIEVLEDVCGNPEYRNYN